MQSYLFERACGKGTSCSGKCRTNVGQDVSNSEPIDGTQLGESDLTKGGNNHEQYSADHHRQNS
jgi:hypothetical protein